jgi:hypothetical protein
VQYLYKSTSCHEFYGGYGHVHILSTSYFDRFFPNSLDPLDRVVVNLLDEFLLGAMATFRVAAPGVVSTT